MQATIYKYSLYKHGKEENPRKTKEIRSENCENDCHQHSITGHFPSHPSEYSAPARVQTSSIRTPEVLATGIGCSSISPPSASYSSNDGFMFEDGNRAGLMAWNGWEMVISDVEFLSVDT
jgi:hypothetical protein